MQHERRPKGSPAGLVSRDQHPLRTGIPGRRYKPSDYVTPIVDAMWHTDDKAGGVVIRRAVNEHKKRNEIAVMARNAAQAGQSNLCNSLDEFQLDEYSSNASFMRLQNVSPDALCNNCGTTNRADILIGSDGRRVCKCGAEGGVIMSSDYKDTHDTGKSIARGEVHRPLLLDAKSKCLSATAVSKSAKRKHGIGTAEGISAGMADRDALFLSKGNRRKLTNIIAIVDELMSEIGRVDDRIARRVRMDAESVFVQSLKHHAKCNERECQKALFDKPAGVIARESIVYTFDQISSLGMDGVAMPTIVFLQERVQKSSAFNQRDNATQHQSCLAMICALCTSDNNVVCAPVRSAKEASSIHGALSKTQSKAPSKVPFSRQDSDVQTTFIVKLRDAISRLCVEHACPNELRDAAMCSLQDSEFAQKLLDGSIVSLKKSSFATAYVILRSVSEEIKTSVNLKKCPNLQRLGLETADVESMVGKMRSVLPTGIASGVVLDDDELY